MNERRVQSRIDHCLGNDKWFLEHGDVMIQYLLPNISDHTLLLVKLKKDSIRGGHPFEFFNFLAGPKDFHTLIDHVWHFKKGEKEPGSYSWDIEGS